MTDIEKLQQIYEGISLKRGDTVNLSNGQVTQ